jgi:hypothetical protein
LPPLVEAGTREGEVSNEVSGQAAAGRACQVEAARRSLPVSTGTVSKDASFW